MARPARPWRWDDEFGYELICDDKQLAFGEPDPALEQALEQSQ